MISRYENQCCGCATDGYPCRGRFCPLRNVPVYCCDECGEEIEGDVYEIDSDDLCEECKDKRENEDYD